MKKEYFAQIVNNTTFIWYVSAQYIEIHSISLTLQKKRNY